MDDACAHAHPSPSSSSATGPDATTIHPHRYTSPTLPDPAISRQRRLLESRNARFAGKKLSMSDLGTKFTQLIHANDDASCDNSPVRNQENVMPKDVSLNSIGRSKGSRYSLGILEEISNTARNRMPRKRRSIPVYHDNQERPLLDQSPYSSPGYRAVSSEVASPVGFDNFQDNLTRMHLHDLSGNEHGAMVYNASSLTGSTRGARKRKSTPFKPAFDTQDYIDYIEKELEQAKEDLYSPTTNKSLKDQLRASRNDNERLKQEIANLRDTFETQVKRTVEHKTATEAKLKTKVKDLEEELEKKELVLQTLQHRHEDKRLETNTIETLKAAIERLEYDKAAMEEENRSMSKRNEVLSELLAMSPTKSQAFELRSPVREKRNGRPMSLILPRQPSSPVFRPSKSPSAAVSPLAEASLPEHNIFHQIVETDNQCKSTTRDLPSEVNQFTSHDTLDDRAIMLRTGEIGSVMSSSPAHWNLPLHTSPSGETVVARQIPKRKPRKFMSGSTQLKPLLLPALTADIVQIPSTPLGVVSPRSMASRDFSQESFDPTSYFPPRHLRLQSEELAELNDFSEFDSALSQGPAMSEAYSRTSHEPPLRHFPGSESELQERDLDHESEPNLSFVTQMVNPTAASNDVARTDLKSPLMTRKMPSGRGELIRSPLDARSRKSIRSLSYTFSSPALSDIFDLEALSRLEISEARYNKFPPEAAEADGQTCHDIPRPLFSPVSRTLSMGPSATHVSKLIHVPFDGSLQQLNPRKRRSSKLSLDEQPRKHVPHDPQKQGTYPLTSTPNVSPTVQQPYTPMHSKQFRFNPIANSRSTPLARSISPLELLQRRQFGARPLAALTIRTIYGTISRCTSYVREFKRDPLALARRVIANAWFTNWSRYGKLSWWVLGLFLSPISRQTQRDWEWDQYDGEGIAHGVCEGNQNITVADSTTNHPSTSNEAEIENVRSSDHVQHTVLTDTSDSGERKVGWGKSLFLWGKFSMAVMLAVGGAVVKGPGDLLKDLEEREHLEVATSSCQSSTVIDDPRKGEPNNEQCFSHTTELKAQNFRAHMEDRQLPPKPGSDVYDRPLDVDHASPFTFRSCQQLDTYCQSDWLTQAEDHDTLRPAKAQKTHVARLFSPDIVESDRQQESLDSPRTKKVGYHEKSSIDSGPLNRPASPDFVSIEDCVPRHKISASPCE